MIEFEECLKDSPKFRTQLEENELSVNDLENHLEKTAKVCSSVVDTGKLYSQAVAALISEFESLSPLFSKDGFVQGSMKKMCNTLSEAQSCLSILLDQMQRSIVGGIQSFIKADIKKVKDTKKYFDKISDECDNALHKNSQLMKTSKASEIEETENVLIATSSCFSHTALDYSFQINVLQSKRRFYLLGQLLNFMNAQFAFYKQGCEVLNSFEPYLKELNSKLNVMQQEFNHDLKEMEERHTLVQKKQSERESHKKMSLGRKPSDSVLMEGYLFKRASNAFKTWNRRWFTIQNNKVYYQKRTKDVQTELCDLRICTVKHAYDIERRFCFAIVCPTKCWYLQADTEQDLQDWINVMQIGIAKALNESQPDGDSDADSVSTNSTGGFDTVERFHPQYLLEKIRSLPGNNTCADCASPNPKWASINLGIILCIECSGIHRSLGVHISKVRSITLDDWEPESIKLMMELGNDVVNNVYEAIYIADMKKPNESSTRAEREAWIKSKYVEKRFVVKIRPRRKSKLKKLMRQKPVKKGQDGSIRKWSFNKDQDEMMSLAQALTDIPPVAHPETSSESDGSGKEGSEKEVSASPLVIRPHLDSNNEGCSSSEDEWGEDQLKSLPPSHLLYEAAKVKNISLMVLAVANGSDVNWVNMTDGGKSPLQQSVISGSVTASEYLLQQGADVNLRDSQGRTALHHAALHGSTGHACLLLKRGANQEIPDENGENALRIALKYYHADIVTLLRLAKLNDQMKESDISFVSDETFTNVVKDFSNMASQTPERLRRNPDRQTTV